MLTLLANLMPRPTSRTCVQKDQPSQSGRNAPSAAARNWSIPWWFLLAIAAGIALRAYFVVCTSGTYDVNIWKLHATGVNHYGLMAYYRVNPEMNHPPVISIFFANLLRFCTATKIPFHMLERAPFALLDLGTTLLLLVALRPSPHRFLIAACYFLHPLAIIYSSYHGNTDSAMAFFLVLCCLLLVRCQPRVAAVVLGLSLWVKLPAILALPALCLVLPGWRMRFIFAALVIAIGFSTYVPALVLDPEVIAKNIFGYKGGYVQTTAEIPAWGVARIALTYSDSLPHYWREICDLQMNIWITYNFWFYIPPILLVSFLRRKHDSFLELAYTLTAVYSILYGFSNYWAFQYFAWALPFWILGRMMFAIPASVLASSYIYGLYWYLCGDPGLTGYWDFAGHAYWPWYIILLRNLTVLFFFVAAWVYVISSLANSVRHWELAEPSKVSR